MSNRVEWGYIVSKNTRIGLTGWLTPEADFIPCDYGYHSEVATYIMRNDKELHKRKIIAGIKYEDLALREFLYIPMGSKGEGFDGCSHIYIPHVHMTQEQLNWLKENYSRLDEVQQDWLDKMGNMAGWEVMENED